VVVAGGEALTPELREWFDDILPGVTVNEIYGQTEANVFVTTCHEWFEPKAGSSGKVVPGHDAAVLDPRPARNSPGEVGEFAIAYEDDPMVVYLEYWNAPGRRRAHAPGGGTAPATSATATRRATSGTSRARTTSSSRRGYRVGPGEVETTLLEHPSVAQAGVVGVPDEARGERIKAFVQVGQDAEECDALREDLREWVRDRLAEYEYPREIAFVSEFPPRRAGSSSGASSGTGTGTPEYRRRWVYVALPSISVTMNGDMEAIAGPVDNVSEFGPDERSVLKANIAAGRAVGNLVRTTMGPRGMDKLLVDKSGMGIVTNNGASILREMVDHPVGDMVADVAVAQQDEVNDGTTTAATVVAELLGGAEELIDQDVHPTTIAAGISRPRRTPSRRSRTSPSPSTWTTPTGSSR